ncbi:MAG TPA: AMP-binding protein [Urbifossiella sp.]|nr:AMP-binding protein [Urbifossiella sp.]
MNAAQFEPLRRLLAEVLPANRFYAKKFAEIGVAARDLRSLDDLARLPFTCKSELAADQAAHPPYGTALTYPIERYSRLHQTSGTSTGRPLRWLDTPESWEAVLRCWQIAFPIMGLTPRDRVFFPFSFGPFIGFWSAFEAASRFGALVIPGGGMTSTARLRFLIEQEATVIFATPTYALHLAELAAAEGIDLAGSSVRMVVVAGEPGGTIPATRQRIEQVWGARVIDHYGMTEIGPVAIEAEDSPGEMVMLESEYIAEIVDAADCLAGTRSGALRSADSASRLNEQIGELVLTNLHRTGSPLIRYRTGDLVRLVEPPGAWRRLHGGILGRSDDMIHVRGNNLYPAAIEAIIRRFPAVVEYRILVDHSGPLADLRIEVEAAANCDGRALADAVGRAVRDDLLFRVDVAAAPPGSLPRFELKARRVVRC